VRQRQPVPALLVVDDTMSIRALLIHALRSLVPSAVIAVTDATAAFAVLTARPIPLVITDDHLADMRGDELASAVKAVSPTIKVLRITAGVELDAEAGWEHVDHCLITPFPMRDLVAVVRTVLPGTTSVR
jgi:DNA-binding NtrC family response regulator